MNEKISVFVIWVEAIIYFLLDNMHDFTFKHFNIVFIHCSQKIVLSLMKDSQKANKKGSLKKLSLRDTEFFLVSILLPSEWIWENTGIQENTDQKKLHIWTLLT